MKYNSYETIISVTLHDLKVEIKRNGCTMIKVIDKGYKGVYSQLEQIYDNKIKRKVLDDDTEAIRKALEILTSRFKEVN